MSLILLPVVAEFLELAGGKDAEGFIVELITKRLEPPRRIRLYLRLREEYLKTTGELWRNYLGAGKWTP